MKSYGFQGLLFVFVLSRHLLRFGVDLYLLILYNGYTSFYKGMI